MGTSRMNVWLRNSACDLLSNVWRTDLVVQACTGSYLVDTFPEIVEQLKKRYATPAKVSDVSSWPLAADQAGKKLQLTIDGGSMQEVTFTTPAQTLAQVFAQVEGAFTGCKITVEDGHLKVVTDGYGPAASIVVGGDCDIAWAPPVDGAGYKVVSHYYQGAKRIMLLPPSGSYINHIELDVPPGCYKVWTRVCHGNNEETSVQMVNVRCDEHACVNLLLPQLKTCAAYVMHPLMDKIVYEQLLADDDQRVVAFRAVMHGAQIAKQEVINQLNYRLQEAVDKDDTELQARVNAVIAVANQLPDCQ